MFTKSAEIYLYLAWKWNWIQIPNGDKFLQNMKKRDKLMYLHSQDMNINAALVPGFCLKSGESRLSFQELSDHPA